MFVFKKAAKRKKVMVFNNRAKLVSQRILVQCHISIPPENVKKP